MSLQKENGYTSDAGNTWVEQISGADHSLMGVSFVDTYYGWTVGNIGTILHTDDGGGVVSIEEKRAFGNNLSLVNYPNPINLNTTLSYSLSESSEVTLSIHNISGLCISILVNEFQQQGKRSVIFDSSGLKPGVYFCILKTNTEIQTKKILKL